MCVLGRSMAPLCVTLIRSRRLLSLSIIHDKAIADADTGRSSSAAAISSSASDREGEEGALRSGRLPPSPLRKKKSAVKLAPGPLRRVGVGPAMLWPKGAGACTCLSMRVRVILHMRKMHLGLHIL